MAKRKSKKTTANQREYAKQVKRIKSFISRAEKRGYRFESNILPETPQRITKKTIQRLQDLTPNKLYEKATTIDYETGEIIGGLEGRKLERKERARKSAETRKRKKQKKQEYYPNGGDIIMHNVLDEFITRLSEPVAEFGVTPKGRKYRRRADIVEASARARHTLLNITYNRINEIGRDALGWVLEESANEVSTLTDYIIYGSDATTIASACSELATIINGGALTLEQMSDLAEQEEYNESWGSELYNEN